MYNQTFLEHTYIQTIGKPAFQWPPQRLMATPFAYKVFFFVLISLVVPTETKTWNFFLPCEQWTSEPSAAVVRLFPMAPGSWQEVAELVLVSGISMGSHQDLLSLLCHLIFLHHASRRVGFTTSSPFTTSLRAFRLIFANCSRQCCELLCQHKAIAPRS